MKAAVYLGVGEIRVREMPKPRPGPGDVVVKVRVAGVCGTDIKTYHRGHPSFKPPAILGHEFSGTVEEAGSKVTWLHAGDRVSVAPYLNCGKCSYCNENRGELCENKTYLNGGAFAEFVLVPEEIARRGTVRLPDRVSFEEGALFEPLACCIRALSFLRLKADSLLLVVGAGFMGLLNAMAARAMFGTKNVVIAEIDPVRRQIAQDLGFAVVDPSADSGSTSGTSGTLPRGEADAVIVAVGSPEAFAVVPEAVKRGGVVHIFGGMSAGANLTVPSALVHYSGVTIVGSSGFAAEDYHLAAKMVSEGRIDVRSLVGARFGLEEVEKAILATGGSVLKTVIVP
ncbi:MAG TPA: alcohol dehydrogenase catalytic domain-containing protein [Firmicutes bacterium]|nr:alcohol dehydrogenase catalytic domain-containing protein [Candidatus Fermentithermobacillaceae bacterium]